MQIDYTKNNGLVPAIVQDVHTQKVLMMGYMNEEAFQKTQESGKVTFFSRSKQRLWTKGETSGNYLLLKDINVDCDHDTLLIQAEPIGPVCHTGSDTCWDKVNKPTGAAFLPYLQSIIRQRRESGDEKSYTKSLFEKGINKIAQKVGEEAVEVVIEAKDNNDELFKNESADLLFHFLILLEAKGFSLEEVVKVLQDRHH